MSGPLQNSCPKPSTRLTARFSSEDSALQNAPTGPRSNRTKSRFSPALVCNEHRAGQDMMRGKELLGQACTPKTARSSSSKGCDSHLHGRHLQIMPVSVSHHQVEHVRTQYIHLTDSNLTPLYPAGSPMQGCNPWTPPKRPEKSAPSLGNETSEKQRKDLRKSPQ